MARPGRPLKVHPDLEYFDNLIIKKDTVALKKLIDKHGIDAYDGDKRTILINSVALGNIEIARFATENGANVNFQDQSGYTSLHFCAIYKYLELTDLLIENDADVNVCDKYGNTPVYTAIINSKGDFSIVHKLIRAGADIEIKNNNGKSARKIGETLFKDIFIELLKG